MFLWLGGGRLPTLPQHVDRDWDLWRFIDARVREIVARMDEGRAQSLLSAPTHARGWLDPRVFVNRLSRLLSEGSEPPPCDLIQAMLRLAPDGRREALAAAAELPGSAGRAVRWALGDDAGPIAKDREQASLWLAAGRARSPRGEHHELAELGIDRSVPGAVTPVRYECSTGIDEFDDVDRVYYYLVVQLIAHPPTRNDDADRLRPTVSLHKQVQDWPYYGTNSYWMLQWLQLVWPLNADPYLAAGVTSLVARIDGSSSTLEPHHVFLEPLFERDRPWRGLACLAVWIGLLSKGADSRGTAMDVLIEAIDDGRAHPHLMGEILALIFASGWMRLNRLAESLSEVARLSPLHAWFAASVLESLVASYEELPRDAHHVLSLLLELLTDLGMALNPDARQTLDGIRGSSKAAKAARGLLALEINEAAPAMKQAKAKLLENRIVRAERWS